ncbi:MAG: response regulator [Planctomycetaceae bacterium]|nr:MAG: response regulator [Planctomycetaceae bacterium]
MKKSLRETAFGLAARLWFWLVLSAVVATADVFAAATWSVCVLQLTVLWIALQFLARQQIPRLIAAIAALTLLAGIIRLGSEPFSPARWWVLAGLIAAAAYHFEIQRRRRRRLEIRQQLQQRVWKRNVQIRRINDALRREIARRQETQQRLSRAETHLESLAQRMQLQVLRKDIDGVITYANEAFCRGIGKSVDEVIGSTDADLYPSTIATSYRTDDERVILTGQPVDHIESHPAADGRTGWVQVFKAPEYDAQNRVIGIQMVFWDVTDSYRKTEELRRSAARKRALLDAAREAVLLVDATGVVVESNPAAEAMLSINGRQLVGRRLEQIASPESTLANAAHSLESPDPDHSDPDHGDAATSPPPVGTVTGLGKEADVRPAGQAETERLASDAPPAQPMRWTDLPLGKRREIVLRTAGAASFPAEVSVHPIPLENSFGLAIFIRDVTLRHRAVEALRQAKLAAEEASRIKSEFMANVSHEIRTPLGGITGSAELLDQMELSPRARQYVDMIRTSGELLSGVIGDILDLASIEAGRLQISATPTDLHRCLGEPFRALATKAMGKDLELILDIRPDVPRVAMFDANRLRQIVINLAGNAIKFTPRGYVRFGVEVEDNEWLKLEMTDSGIGIAEDRLAKIFEPFEQGDSGTTRRFGGTGLGLSISEQLVRRMGGSINVISIPGQGSTFRCRLPLPSLDESAADGLAEHQVGVPPAVPQNDRQPLGVALEIPHPLQREAIQDSLMAAGYRIDPRSPLRIVDQSLAWRQSERHASDPQARTIWLARVDEPTADGQDPADPVLIKPILADDLLAWLREETEPDPLDRPASDAHNYTPSAVKRFRGSGHVAERPSADPTTEDLPGNRARSAGTHGSSVDQPQLLLVDDSPVNRSVIREFLTAAGYGVALACDGDQAIETIRKRPFDCVLMDLQMPGMDGIETMREILRELEGQGRPAPPFIALTAHATQEHRRRCLEEGMRDFLVKPIDRLELLRSVAANLATSEVPNPTDVGVSATSAAEQVAESSGGTPPVATSEAPAGDWAAKFAKLGGGDPAVTGSLIEAFLTEVPELARELSRATSERDPAAASRAAHTLKSCLRYVAPDSEWQLAQRIESAADTGDWSTADTCLKKILPIAERWVERISGS